MLNDADLERYARQANARYWRRGSGAPLAARVLLVGAGGLGSPPVSIWRQPVSGM